MRYTCFFLCAVWLSGIAYSAGVFVYILCDLLLIKSWENLRWREIPPKVLNLFWRPIENFLSSRSIDDDEMIKVIIFCRQVKMSDCSHEPLLDLSADSIGVSFRIIFGDACSSKSRNNHGGYTCTLHRHKDFDQLPSLIAVFLCVAWHKSLLYSEHA